MPYRKRTKLSNNLEKLKPNELCKKHCGNVRDGKHIATAQRMPNGRNGDWSENARFSNRMSFFKVPDELISEIFESLTESWFLKTRPARAEEVVLELDDPARIVKANYFCLSHSADGSNGESLCHQEWAITVEFYKACKSRSAPTQSLGWWIFTRLVKADLHPHGVLDDEFLQGLVFSSASGLPVGTQ